MNKVKIVYQICLKRYNRIIKHENYLSFSKMQLTELLLGGSVTILNKKDNTFFHFEAELIHFLMVFYDDVKELSNSPTGKKEIYSPNDTYFFELKKIDYDNIRIILDKDKTNSMMVDFHSLLLEILNVKKMLFEDLTILYPNLINAKEFNFLNTLLNVIA